MPPNTLVIFEKPLLSIEPTADPILSPAAGVPANRIVMINYLIVYFNFVFGWFPPVMRISSH